MTWVWVKNIFSVHDRLQTDFVPTWSAEEGDLLADDPHVARIHWTNAAEAAGPDLWQ